MEKKEEASQFASKLNNLNNKDNVNVNITNVNANINNLISKDSEIEKQLEELKVELKLRGFSQNTILAYMFHNRNFLLHAKKQPEQIIEQDVKAYIASKLEKLSPTSIALVRASLKFFYDDLLKKKLFDNIKTPKKARKLPSVLTREEVRKLIDSAETKKSKLIISMLYASGLRLSELINLRVSDLEMQEKIGWVRKGKGQKDRAFILSENLLKLLETHISKDKLDAASYIFSGRKEKEKMTPRNVQKIIKLAAKKAEINKKVSPHTMRHSFGTHLLNSGVDIRKIQQLLGHSLISTTQLYTQITTEDLKKVKSPFDEL